LALGVEMKRLAIIAGLAFFSLSLATYPVRAQQKSVFEVGAEEDARLAKKPLLNLAGNWSGTTDDSLAGEGTYTAMITQSGKHISGSWSARFSDFTNSGTLTGTVTTDSVSIFLDRPITGFPKCHGNFKAKPATDTSISGTYKTSACGKDFKGEHGTISITPASS
jgi:hypothetical protein